MKKTYEKLGLFYLGKDVDKNNFEPSDTLTLLKNKNFTTHAAIIGMTGSGKTGLGIDIIEEAAIDNIPAIIIDPKGDMGNLCLTDPKFSTDSFSKWVKDEAQSNGDDIKEYAKKTANMWKEGVENSEQDANRVAKFSAVEKSIYTPGSQAGIPINLMGVLELPNDNILDNNDNFSAYLKSSVMALLSLVGIDADPMDSKEYILLSQIISKSWIDRESIGIDELIVRIINPPFDKIGVLPLDSFYPDNDRFKFASKFNAVIALPSFANWLKGESLNIQNLLYDEDGKAKISIFSISHLNDDERMFFVTLLLNKYIAWMRLQSGSSRLKNILYMDEIYGFFPPVKNPPSKEPMITLLKQARAYGTGIILSTQNPVDLDYKGLSNIGTWFIGRLQTTQDIDRVIDGLGGKIDSSFDKKEIKNLLANLRKRTFFLKSAHLEDIRLFGTRWAMSYLKGPLAKDEISMLMETQKESMHSISSNSLKSKSTDEYEAINTVDSSTNQYFELDPTGKNLFNPYLCAKAEVYYFDQRRSIEETKEQFYSLSLDDVNIIDWDSASTDNSDFYKLPHKEPKKAQYAQVPSFIKTDKSLRKSSSNLKEYIYKNSKLQLFKCSKLRLESAVGDTKQDFIIKVQNMIDDKKEIEIDKLKERYETKEQRLKSQLTRAMERIEKEKGDQLSSIISMGTSILGALFGRATVSKVGTAVSRGSKALKERGDVTRAEAKLADIEDKIDDLSNELEAKIDDFADKYTIENYEIKELAIKAKKRDINVDNIAIVWRVS